jgi:hypothetical protein
VSIVTRIRFANAPCLLAVALLGAGALTACAQQPADAPPANPVEVPKGTDQLKPEYDAAGKLTKLEYDRNKDGKVDAWGYMNGAAVVRVEVDENGDGQVDRWEYHRAEVSPAAASSAAPAGVDRTVERIERSTRFDGKVSRKELFTDGVLAAIEEDTDGDGKVDKWERYTDGGLAVLELDTQSRGTPDRRLVYRADGALDHIEADPAGSGNFSPLKP